MLLQKSFSAPEFPLEAQKGFSYTTKALRLSEKKLQTFYLISLSDNLKTRRDYASSTDLVNA